jgi:hypothetical protein
MDESADYLPLPGSGLSNILSVIDIADKNQQSPHDTGFVAILDFSAGKDIGMDSPTAEGRGDQ